MSVLTIPPPKIKASLRSMDNQWTINDVLQIVKNGSAVHFVVPQPAKTVLAVHQEGSERQELFHYSYFSSAAAA